MLRLSSGAGRRACLFDYDRVLSLLYEGKSDAEIASALGGKSASTVRNHRFQLRRRESEARVFLALMKLLDEKGAGAGQFIEYPASAGSAQSGFVMHSWPKRQKEKLVLLRRIAELFEPVRRYKEKEVNAILLPVWDDYVTIRRYLIEYRFLDRKPDGSEYWRT